MAYQVRLSLRAERQMDRLPGRDLDRILAAIPALSDNPRPRGAKKLRARHPAWRIRVGNYRIIYTVFDPDRLVVIDAVLRRTTTTYSDID